jgi:hypothetical protein
MAYSSDAEAAPCEFLVLNFPEKSGIVNHWFPGHLGAATIHFYKFPRNFGNPVLWIAIGSV